MPVGRFKTFTVVPYLPERLSALRIIAYNLWWCWHHEAIALFRRIDDELFEALEHSPVKLLGAIDQSRLIALCHDAGFIAHLDRVERALVDYMTAPTWFQQTYHDPHFRLAYFSAEFGIHESVPIYSGGLGVLAGDHLKSASDLGLPLSGVSLMYRQGYFRQYLNLDGWQQEQYPENDFYNLPLISEQGPDGQQLMVSVPFPGREVFARVWRLQVGRVSLYLLDTNVPRNRAEDREITAQLYGGDQEMRIKQEMILGIGGYRALRALGQTPTVCHMNEGHSAFLALERIRFLMGQSNLSFQEAQEVIAAGNVFTTHTPVPAGNDRFPAHLMEHYLGWYQSAFKVGTKELLALGRENPQDTNELFCMTVLALKLANSSNGVSKLHGKVSRKMWRNLWPELPETEVPVTAVVNGIHLGSWMSQEMHHLLERYLGVAFTEKPSDPKVWQRVENIPDAEMWRAHERNREQLVVYARKKLKAQLQRRGASIHEITKADEVLDPETLTIGFARRSATYKRGTLIFRDLERLNRILNNKDRPVQLLFAGKAHPHDKAGKELIQRMSQVAKMPEYRRRIVFLEDYDINVARHLVHGVDVWLNNPRRPLEASGTSGMKVTANGGLHWSILDGWWAEGYDQENGFAIGAGKVSKEVAGKLKEWSDKFREKEQELRKEKGVEFGKGGGFGKIDDEMRAKINAANKAISEEAYKQLGDLLTKAQIDRVKQIERQQLGLAVFTNEEIVAALKLTDSQKTSIKGTSEDYAKERREIFGDGGFGGKGKFDATKFKENQAKGDKLQKEYMGKLTDLLDESQKKTLTEKLGASFDISKLNTFGGGFGKKDAKKD